MTSLDSSLPTPVSDAAETDPMGLPHATAPRHRSTLPTGVAASRGILHCRRGEWHSGLHYLQQVDASAGDVTLPGIYFSYLGLALARCQRKHDEAVELCERAVALGFYDPENYLNLAWSKMLAGDRSGALRAVERGLELDARHAGLSELQRRLGQRRTPVLRFLHRSHPLNVKLGRWRHAYLQRKAG